jgi:hypothetical protein
MLSKSALNAYDRVASGIGRVVGFLAENGAKQIRKQVASGLDRHGRRMVGYKPNYAERKGSAKVDLRSNRRVKARREGKPMMDDIIFDAPSFSEFGNGGGRFRESSTGRFTKAAGYITFGSEQSSRIAGALISGKAGGGHKMAGPRDFFGLNEDWVKANTNKEFQEMFAGATSGLKSERLNIRLL